MKKYLFVVVLGIFVSSSAIAGPGYVSRDCSAFGTKESITLDWWGPSHWFKTRALVIANNGLPQWFNGSSHDTADFPTNKGQPSENVFKWGEKNHAGFTLNRTKFNQYKRGVQGWHYLINRSTGRVENRVAATSSCQLQDWAGLITGGNW